MDMRKAREERHLFTIKMKEIIKKLKIKVSVKVRLGVGRACCPNKAVSV